MQPLCETSETDNEGPKMTPSAEILAASAALRERMNRSVITVAALAAAPPVAGHDVTVTDADVDDSNMAALDCTCGYHADVTRAAITLLTLEHTRRPGAHSNAANSVN